MIEVEATAYKRQNDYACVPTLRIALAAALLSVTPILSAMAADGSPTPILCNGKIAFRSGRDGHSQIYVMNADGSNQTQLTNTTGDYEPSFSGDGSKIAFVSNRDGHSQVYIMNADGSNQTRLTNNTFATNDVEPSFSGDGSKIAFMSRREPDYHYDIYVMNADGSNQRRLTNTSADEPSFSPDGSKIAFRDGDFQIHVMNADGSNQTRLTNMASNTDPSFSGDGSKLAFISNRDGIYHVYVMNADGSSQIRLTNSPANDFEPSFAGCQTLTIALHGVSPAAPAVIANLTAGVDEPLQLVPSESILQDQPSVAQGLVADGVTPLIIELDSIAPPATPTTYQIAMIVSSANPAAGALLAQHLHVLQSGSFVPGTVVTLSADHPKGFAYLTGFKTDEFFEPGEHAATVTINIQDQKSAVVATKTFIIRAPPVVLVHGYNATKDSWGGQFLQRLIDERGQDFVVPIEYGVERSAFGIPLSPPNPIRNTRGRLPDLAVELDGILVNEVEQSSGSLRHSDWAFTRYDVVGHSQGGVLLRMLCASGRRYSPSQQLFYSSPNLYRGRFRRIVTIGSPHNGSLFYAWVKALDERSGSLGNTFVRFLLYWMDLLQPKFDPFGPQIHDLNLTLIDPRAKFHALQFTTTGGDPPVSSFSAPFINTIGLDERVTTATGEHTYKYALIFPHGSDGVVERSSQGAGIGTMATFLSGYPVSHATPELVFGVPEGSTETNLSTIADRVLLLLNDDDAAFGQFVNPVSRPLAELNTLLKLAGATEGGQPLAVTPLTGFWRLEGPKGGDLQFAVSLPDGTLLAPDSEVFWTAGFPTGTGFSTEGITVVQDIGNPLRAIVSVASSIVGDIVVSASFYTQNDTFVVTRPTLVISTATAPEHLLVYPENLSLSVHEQTTVDVSALDSMGRIFPSFVGDNRIMFQSDNSSIANVDLNGAVTGQSPGNTTIHITFRGLNANVPVTVIEAPATLRNISTRLRVETGDNVLIGGFIVTGTQPKRVIIRAIGPSLSDLGVSDVLADPALDLHDSTGATIATNNNWRDTQQIEIEATGIPPSRDLESAIVRTLLPGNYTAIMHGNGGDTGVGLLEVYDLDSSADSQLANISTRGFVDSGDNVMIGGLIAGPVGVPSGQMLVRAIGPSLAAVGVANALQDPTLELHDGNGALIAVNDDWKDTQQAEIEVTGIAPTSDKESAILSTLSPGNYTAIVRGKNQGTGVGLVEVYNLQ